jgi:hypothetical protein
MFLRVLSGIDHIMHTVTHLAYFDYCSALRVELYMHAARIRIVFFLLILRGMHTTRFQLEVELIKLNTTFAAFWDFKLTQCSVKCSNPAYLWQEADIIDVSSLGSRSTHCAFERRLKVNGVNASGHET